MQIKSFDKRVTSCTVPSMSENLKLARVSFNILWLLSWFWWWQWWWFWWSKFDHDYTWTSEGTFQCVHIVQHPPATSPWFYLRVILMMRILTMMMVITLYFKLLSMSDSINWVKPFKIRETKEKFQKNGALWTAELDTQLYHCKQSFCHLPMTHKKNCNILVDMLD